MIPPDPESRDPAIRIDELSKRYGEVQAIRNLSLEVLPGEIFGFLGLNGAGKTTTIRILLDLIRADGGSCSILGFDCHRDSLDVRRRVGYLPGELALYPHMTGDETLDLLARLDGVPVNRGYREELLERIELSAVDLRRKVREFSTGMKRKLGIVQALQADPELLILDEPTEGLDPLVQRSLNQLLFDLRNRGRTIFLTSHVLSEVERTCDRIGVIRNGELVLTTTVQEARRLGGRVVRLRFDQPVPELDLPAGMSIVERTDTEWTIQAAADLGELMSRLGSLPVRDIEIDEPALEDVLEHFYREKRS